MSDTLERVQFENYIIYKDGTVESLLTGKKITKRVGPRGYYQINLCINGKCKTFMLHRLIAKAFIENPNNLPCVNHIDGNKLNNDLSNLEWVTYSENIRHAFRTGLCKPVKGRKTKCGRFSEDEIKEIRRLSNNKILSWNKIAKQYGVTKSAIQCIVQRKSYVWVSD